MRLTIEVLDHKTLSWNLLACQEGVNIEAAPAIVAVLREGLPLEASIRWNWSRAPLMGEDGTPLAPPTRPAARRGRTRRR